ncbi:MAG: bifunctional helix-turn-helix domain-containing protein/methylated-DNA--[protein]-cysteine S-methyltransferase [Hyphomicrobiales bacterium]
MKTQQLIDYGRVERAIKYIAENFRENPSLDEIAAAIHLSPYHFQRLFSNWAGVSPKKFMQYVSLNYAKKALIAKERALLGVAHDVGLSGTGRLHDLFVTIEGMTPGRFKMGGAELSINYSYAQSPFGTIIIASTSRGLCHMAFAADCTEGFARLRAAFPNASYRQSADRFHQAACLLFRKDWSRLDEIKLCLRATPFQLKVWEALLKIPMGALTTYGKIAEAIGQPNASRAVGGALGSNPVAFLIPCHRVIRKSGEIGGYMWGPERKRVMIAWEGAQTNSRTKDHDNGS